MSRRVIPSVDRVLRDGAVAAHLATHGRAAVLQAVRAELAGLRAALAKRRRPAPQDASLERISERVAARLAAESGASLRPVFNLTGTVLHTNLGRASLPLAATEALTRAAGNPVSLEYDLAQGKRGDRERHLAAPLARLTGAQAATAVNNNAAALLLVLNTLALRREVLVSRGELVEIGGEFRLPAIMQRAGCRLVEVGTTNRTHLRDYAEALGPRTAMLLKVHPSNYRIEGFTAAVEVRALAGLARKHGLPLVADLGAGALVDLRRWNLPHETTPAETLAAGAELVTFSGDKLLGGPQAGLIAGRRDLIERLNRNPLKRALRLDKLRIAALEALLRLYRDPDRLAERLPALRQLARPLPEIEAQARRLLPPLQAALGGHAVVSVERCESQVGSGSLPEAGLESVALRICPRAPRRGASARAEALGAAFRSLPLPVIGRVHDAALWLDLRALEEEDGFTAQLRELKLPSA